MVVGQTDEGRRRLNVVKSFYVKYTKKLPDLVNEFCKYYHYFKNHEVIFYFDTTALGSNYAVNDEDTSVGLSAINWRRMVGVFVLCLLVVRWDTWRSSCLSIVGSMVVLGWFLTSMNRTTRVCLYLYRRLVCTMGRRISD